MPTGLGTKGKGKGKDGSGRHSRSRNTTPSSAVSVPISGGPPHTAYLEISLGAMVASNHIMYDEILERHGGNSGIPDLKHLEALRNDLSALSQIALNREKVCDGGMRELSSRRKQKIEEDMEFEQANRDAEEKATLKRSAVDDEQDRSNKVKMKRRKDQSKIREERPLNHGAHGVARQDGIDTTSKGKAMMSPAMKASTASGSSSSLSPPSQIQSPIALEKPDQCSARNSPARSSSSESHQPPPAASIPQYQTFGSNPLEFDDPTVYHVRDVREEMTDDEKKGIYCVSVFPHSDLKDLIAGTPPDKDFSNAKPTNQVNANTFATYIEPFFRLLTDEDMAFLKERGDRVTPFLTPGRGTKHYSQIWAEEDGSIVSDIGAGKDRLAANQGRGNIEQMDDDVAETDQVSTGPMLSRLLSTMRVEHRPEEKEKPNGVHNGEVGQNGLVNGDVNGDNAMDGSSEDRSVPATAFSESNSTTWKNTNFAKQDYVQTDERLKAELRYIGFLGQDDEPDYESHYDDEVSQRLRFLQAELKKQMVINGARKARLHQIAEEHMGYQEFAHIKDDLDNQVVQAFSKRNRTLGKGKKNAKRPGGAGGGSHPAGGHGSGAGISRPGIGDAARTIMDRRKRWNDTISPIFSEDIIKVRGSEESIFKDRDMAPFIAAEKDRLEEEAE